MTIYFDKKGKPITEIEHDRLIKDNTYRIVAYTKLDNGTEIKTEWIGILQHNSGLNLFKTTLQEVGSSELWIHRYRTEEEAQTHHQHLVETYYDEQELIGRWSQVTDEL